MGHEQEHDCLMVVVLAGPVACVWGCWLVWVGYLPTRVLEPPCLRARVPFCVRAEGRLLICMRVIAGSLVAICVQAHSHSHCACVVYFDTGIVRLPVLAFGAEWALSWVAFRVNGRARGAKRGQREGGAHDGAGL